MAKDQLYDFCEKNNILFSTVDLEPFFKLLNVLHDDGMIDYKKFVDLIDPNLRPPELMPVKGKMSKILSKIFK